MLTETFFGEPTTFLPECSPRHRAQCCTRRPFVASLAAVLALALTLILGFIALPPNAVAQTLDEEQCALRIPLDKFKDEVRPGIQEAMLVLESHAVANGALNVEAISLIGIKISKSGGRIKLRATFYVAGNYVIPFFFFGISVYLKWVDDEEGQDWEDCDGIRYPDFVVDDINCFPILDLHGYIHSAALCSFVNYNSWLNELITCEIQNEVQNSLAELLDEVVIDDEVANPLNPEIEWPVIYLMRDLIRDAGGVRLSDDHLYMMLPCVEGCDSPRGGLFHPPPRGRDEEGCVGTDFCVRLRVGVNVLEDPGNPPEEPPHPPPDGHTYVDVNFQRQGVDIPRYARDLIQQRIDEGEPTYGAQVVCRHEPVCSSGQDADGDGFCDAVDHCPNTWTSSNFDKDGDGLGDGPGPLEADADEHQCLDERPWQLTAHYTLRLEQDLNLPGDIEADVNQIVACRRECDNCPQNFNPLLVDTNSDGVSDAQLDLDFDNYGDECDADIDGDGYLNEYDCNQWIHNGGGDLDRDGYCDLPIPSVEDCNQSCWDLLNTYGGSVFHHTYNCVQACERGQDNCIYPPNLSATTEYCGMAFEPARCNDQSIGLDEETNQWRLGFTGLVECQRPDPPPDFTQCRTVYANDNQGDGDNDGIGDRCDGDTVGNVTLEPVEYERVNLPGGAHSFWGREYRIGFNTLGGQVSFNAANEPIFTPSQRTDFRVGACACDLDNPNFTTDEWDFPLGRCFGYQICNGSGEFNPQGIYSWNAINTPNTSNDLAEDGATLRYRLTPWANDFLDIYAHELFWHRTVQFTQDETWNRHELVWPWRDSVQFKTWQANSSDYDAEQSPNLTTRIRVAWPNMPMIIVDGIPVPDPVAQEAPLDLLGYSYSGPDAVVAYSNYQFVRVGSSVSGNITLPTIRSRITKLPIDIWFDRLGPVGYFLTDDPVIQDSRLFSLSPDSLQLASVHDLYFSDQRNLDTELTGVVGPILHDTGQGVVTERALFTYQQGSYGAVTEHPDDLTPAVLYIGSLSGQGTTARSVSASEPVSSPTRVQDGPVFLESTVARYGTIAPALFQAQLAATRGERLLLVGSRSPSDLGVVALSLDLITGQWSTPVLLPVRSGLQGYSLNFDPVAGEMLLFGGQTPDGHVSANVIAIHPATLSVRHVRTASKPPAAVARGDAGTFFDRVTRSLYVCGGRRGEALLTDAWRFDLSSHSWRRVDTGTASESPGPMISPFVYVEPASRRLWVGDFVSSDLSEGLSFHVRDRFGQWQAARQTLQRDYLAWPVDDRYLDGRSHLYGFTESADTSWPGQLRLAQLLPESPDLRVAVTDLSGVYLGASFAGASSKEEAAFRCPSGTSCLLEVRPNVGVAQPGGVAFTLDAHLAEALPEASLDIAGQVKDLLLSGDYLFVAATSGVRIVDRESLAVLGVASVHPVRGLARCGVHLCGVKGGKSELVVLDVREPTAPLIVGRVPSAGNGLGIAAWGRRVYVAMGRAGVGVYDVSEPTNPSLVDTVPLPSGAKAVTVAAGGSLLAVGLEQGRVLLYRLSASAPSQLGEVQARGKIQSVRIVNGQLWVLGKHSAWLEGFDLADPTASMLLGSVESGAASTSGPGPGDAEIEAIMRAQFRGPWRYWHDQGRLYRDQVVPID